MSIFKSLRLEGQVRSKHICTEIFKEPVVALNDHMASVDELFLKRLPVSLKFADRENRFEDQYVIWWYAN